MGVDDSLKCSRQDRPIGAREMLVEVAVDAGQVQRRGLLESVASSRREGGQQDPAVAGSWLR